MGFEVAEQMIFGLGTQTKVRVKRKGKKLVFISPETPEERRARQRGYQRAWSAKNKEKEKAKNQAYREANRERENARSRQWFIDNPDYRANHRLKKRYGITLAQKSEMLIEQNGCCAICKSPDARSGTGWHLDHCHDSNKVRGVLCAPCNIMLGGARDNVETLARAITYLKLHGDE